MLSKSSRRLRFFALVMGVVLLAVPLILMWVPEAPEAGPLCSGKPLQARFDENGLLPLPPVRTDYWQYQGMILWAGGRDGELIKYDTNSGLVELCRNFGAGFTINSIFGWKESIWVALDAGDAGGGVWEYVLKTQQWIEHSVATEELLDDRTYCLVPSTDGDTLYICTIAGISQIYRGAGVAPEPFQLPPDNVVNFHDIEPFPNGEVWLCSIKDGVYTHQNGLWTHFNSKGVQTWNSSSKKWISVLDKPVVSDKCRDLQLMFDGYIGIAGDASENALVFIPLNVQDFSAQVSPEFKNLTSITLGPSGEELQRGYAVTDYLGGAYFVNFQGDKILVTDIESNDSAWVSTGDFYFATQKGIVRYHVPQ
ncbi:MAG: hypothetical protein ABI425_05830 [Patescibacteria group bacterium]